MSYPFLNAVHHIVAGEEPCLYVADLEEIAVEEQLTFRDVIRTAFAEYGVDIEYSGKNQNERGVVIDIDEEKFATINPNVNTLRFGQTVVRVR